MRPRRLLPVWMLIVLALLAAPEGVCRTINIVTAQEIKEFFATGGRACIGHRVHIHLSAAVLKKKPKQVRLSGGRIALQLENQSVPILINPRNIYYRRLKGKKELRGLVCIKGSVYRPEWDLKGRCFLWVDTVKTYGGKLDAIEGTKD